MAPRDVKKYLFDAEKACERISRFIQERSLDSFLIDEVLRSAVERQCEIVGESLKRALDLDASLSERISDLRRIIDFRNRLIHGYYDISAEIVWGIASHDIPLLRTEIEDLLKQ